MNRAGKAQKRGSMSRVIIFTGKGGVGKTTVAAAHARKAAANGKKTLIVSTDMAHNLCDLFEQELGREPKEAGPNLYALEIDPDYEMNQHYGSIMNAVKSLVIGTSAQNLEAFDDLAMFPGIEELFSLIRIQEIYRSGEYELIIVDCAPTGETLSLLKFPELLSWYMEKLFPLGKVAMKVLRPISRQVFKLELPDAQAMNDIERLYLKLAELESLLKDRDICSIRLVAMPEKMVVEETKRSYMYLNLYNFNVDGLYINRVLPADLGNDFFDEWIRIQSDYIQELESVFAGMPVYRIPWYDLDLNGMEGLDRIAGDCLADTALFEVRCSASNEVFEKTEEGYVLTVCLPCAKKEEIELHQSKSDMILRIGNFKRSIPLPGTLARCQVDSARLENGRLAIRFSRDLTQ